MPEPSKPAPQKIGKYEIIATLGKGAMGVVYRARDPFIGRQVALKTMLKELVEGEEEQQRFFREAQAAGNLKHGNIVTIYELGMDGETAFIAMELLEGSDLKKLMRAQEGLPFSRKIEIVIEILDGLDYAHKRGIVHRDIKPANIHIGDDGNVKIMDFGIARVSTSEMTKTGMVLGTVSYMSPEQVAGQKVDGRSDIFAVGVILYELVTSQKPFPGDTISTIIHRIISKDPEPFSTEGLPPGIEQVIHKALAKDVSDRYASADEMVQDLRAVLQGDSPSLAAAMPVAADRTVLAPGATGTTTKTAVSARTMTGKTLAATVPGRAAAMPAMAQALEPPAPAPRSSATPILLGLGALVLLVVLVGGGAAALILGPKLLGGKPTPVATGTPITTPSVAPSPQTEPLVNTAVATTPEPTPSLVAIATPTPEPTPTQIAAASPPPLPPPETPKATPKEPVVEEEPEPTDEERALAGPLADEAYELIMQNKLSAAEAKLLKAKRYNPGLPNTYLYLVLCYRKMGKGSKAEAVMREADNNIPGFRNNPNVKMLLGGGPSW